MSLKEIGLVFQSRFLSSPACVLSDSKKQPMVVILCFSILIISPGGRSVTRLLLCGMVSLLKILFENSIFESSFNEIQIDGLTRIFPELVGRMGLD